MITLNELSNAALEALHVVARGASSVSNRTCADETNGVRCILGAAAKEFATAGLIRPVAGWPKTVEITEDGRRLIGWARR